MAKKDNRHAELVSASVNIEAPYELPEGWKWTRLGDFIDIHRGVSYKKDAAHKEKQENDCLIMRGGNIDEGKININADNVYVDKSLVSENQFIKKNDVVIVTSTGSTKVIGRAGISDEDYSDVTFGAFLTLARPNGKADKSFVNQYFQSSIYRERIRQLASGVNINNIRLEYITESPFPLPPTLAEQQRIVNRIETMFAKLDQAQEKAQAVLDSFETRKAAILHKAFTGQLRIDNEELKIEDWEEKKLGNIVNGFKYGVSDKCDYKNDGIPVLRIPNIGDGTIDYTDLKYSERNDIEENYIVKENDILIIRSNGSRELVGKSALYNNTEKKFSYGSFLIKITPSEVVNPKYLVTFLNSDDARNQMFNKAKSSSGIHNINTKELSEIRLKLPPLNYQLSIVNFLDTVLEKESRAKEAAQTVLDQIALLKKSILARAFRGEL